MDEPTLKPTLENAREALLAAIIDAANHQAAAAARNFAGAYADLGSADGSPYFAPSAAPRFTASIPVYINGQRVDE